MDVAMKFLCVRTTPLLVPVVPDEYRMAAGSSWSTGGRSESENVEFDDVSLMKSDELYHFELVGILELVSMIQGRLRCLILS